MPKIDNNIENDIEILVEQSTSLRVCQAYWACTSQNGLLRHLRWYAPEASAKLPRRRNYV